MSARRIAERATEELEGLIGRPVEAVSSLRRDGNGDGDGDGDGDRGWVVELEVLELERVPSTMDVLATYRVEVDTDGELQSFERQRRYERSRTEDRA
jgi:hypothetical protein